MVIKTYRLEMDAERHPFLVIEKEEKYREAALNDPAKVVEICNNLMRMKYLAEENVVMVAADTKNKILGLFHVSQGILSSAFCNSREIYMRALLIGAATIFIVHNHPSGDCTPSESDLLSIKQLKDAGKIIGIPIQDFIIIGGNSFFSACSEEMLKK